MSAGMGHPHTLGSWDWVWTGHNCAALRDPYYGAECLQPKGSPILQVVVQFWWEQTCQMKGTVVQWATPGPHLHPRGACGFQSSQWPSRFKQRRMQYWVLCLHIESHLSTSIKGICWAIERLGFWRDPTEYQPTPFFEDHIENWNNIKEESYVSKHHSETGSLLCFSHQSLNNSLIILWVFLSLGIVIILK